MTLLVYGSTLNPSNVVQQVNADQEKDIFGTNSESPKQVCFRLSSEFMLRLNGIMAVAAVLITGMELREGLGRICPSRSCFKTI